MKFIFMQNYQNATPIEQNINPNKLKISTADCSFYI